MEDKDTSVLESYLDNYDELAPSEFEDMVAELLNLEGWSDLKVTSYVSDRGRDVIGINPDGEKSYVEVKMHKSNVGRPVVQKLHSVMITDNIQKGYIVSASGFSPQAIAYAKKVDIELVTGNQFISRCNHKTSGKARKSFLSLPIELEELKSKGMEFVEKRIFSYPKSSINLLKKNKFTEFFYQPIRLIIFSVFQDFTNKSGSFSHTISHNKSVAAVKGDGSFTIWEDVNIDEFIDLEEMQQYFKKAKYKLQLDEKPFPISFRELKRYVQKAATESVIYTGLNNQTYNKKCVPNLSNIKVLGNRIYWALKIKQEFIFPNNLIFFVKSEDLEIYDSDFSDGILMCQDCCNPIPLYNRRNTCRNCGKLICESCIHTEGRGIFERSWCISCRDDVIKGKIKKKKNKEAYKNAITHVNKWLFRYRGKSPKVRIGCLLCTTLSIVALIITFILIWIR